MALALELDDLIVSAAETFFLFASVDDYLPHSSLDFAALLASAARRDYLLGGLSEAVRLVLDPQYSHFDGAGACLGCFVVRKLQKPVNSYIHRLDHGADAPHHSFEPSRLGMFRPMMPDRRQPIP